MSKTSWSQVRSWSQLLILNWCGCKLKLVYGSAWTIQFTVVVIFVQLYCIRTLAHWFRLCLFPWSVMLYLALGTGRILLGVLDPGLANPTCRRPSCTGRGVSSDAGYLGNFGIHHQWEVLPMSRTRQWIFWMKVRYPASHLVKLYNASMQLCAFWSAPEMVTRVKLAWPRHPLTPSLMRPSLMRYLSLIILFGDWSTRILVLVLRLTTILFPLACHFRSVGVIVCV